MFLTCQRSIVDEQFQMVPVKDRLPYEFYKSYSSRRQIPLNIAWSDAFPGLSAWLADRDIDRTERELLSPDDNTRGGHLGMGSIMR